MQQNTNGYRRVDCVVNCTRDPERDRGEQAVMAKDVYETLATHLDSLPAGFARTDSGVEMRILRRLFTPEDAQLAVHLTIIPEEARVIARRAGIPVSEAASRLDDIHPS